MEGNKREAKDVELFLLKSAYELSWFKMVWDRAQILAKSDYDSFYWIEIITADPEPSRFARCRIEIRVMFEVQNVHHSQSSLKIFLTWKNTKVLLHLPRPSVVSVLKNAGHFQSTNAYGPFH